ncbi:hypothetical protein BT69DRAFT_320920 [Atractiella rhizophila]|nr:hypothetical protein BT69DRAFT_320920 [Atractiella rhizophila]
MLLTDFLSQTSYRLSVWRNVHRTGQEGMIGVMESLHPELTLCGDHFKAQFFLQEQLNEVHKLWREEDGLEPKFTRLKGEAPDGLEFSLGSRPSTPLPASCAGVTLKRKPNNEREQGEHLSCIIANRGDDCLER